MCRLVRAVNSLDLRPRCSHTRNDFTLPSAYSVIFIIVITPPLPSLNVSFAAEPIYFHSFSWGVHQKAIDHIVNSGQIAVTVNRQPTRIRSWKWYQNHDEESKYEGPTLHQRLEEQRWATSTAPHELVFNLCVYVGRDKPGRCVCLCVVMDVR